jgi:hypothetical protein
VLGRKRWALRTDDSKDRVLCHSLAPETSDRNRSEGRVEAFKRYKKDALQISKVLIFLSLKGQLSSFPFPLSHTPPGSIENSIQELLFRGRGMNGFSPFPSLSLFPPTSIGEANILTWLYP